MFSIPGMLHPMILSLPGLNKLGFCCYISRFQSLLSARYRKIVRELVYNVLCWLVFSACYPTVRSFDSQLLLQCTVFRQILTHTRTHFHPSDYEIFRLLTYYALSIDLRACIPFGFSLSMAILIARTHSAAHINYKTVLWGFFLFAFFLFLSWPGLA